MTRPTGAGESCDGGEDQDWSTWRGSQQCRNILEMESEHGSDCGDWAGGICIISEGHGEKLTR